MFGDVGKGWIMIALSACWLLVEGDMLCTIMIPAAVLRIAIALVYYALAAR